MSHVILTSDPEKSEMNSVRSNDRLIFKNSLPHILMQNKSQIPEGSNEDNITNQCLRGTRRKSSKRMSQSGNTPSKLQSSVSQIFTSHKVKRPKWQKDLDKFLNSSPVLIFMSTITVFALFASDIQAAWLGIEVDEAFNIIQCFIMALFTIELILNCLCKEEYILSFFFWLDLIATVSLFQDIDYIMDELMGYEPISNSTTSGGSKKNSAQAAKALSKVASASRATRVLRVIRIVRLIRMVKIYKNVYLTRELAEKKKEEERQKLIKKLEKDLSESSMSTSKSTGIENKITKRQYLNHYANGNIDKTQSSPSPSSMKTKDISDVNNTVMPKEEDQKKKEKEKEDKEDQEIDEDELIKESKISKTITESITKKVIVLILGLLIVFPLLSDDFYADDSHISYTLLSQLLTNSFQINLSTDIVYFNMTELFNDDFPVTNITYHSVPIYINPKYQSANFRYREVKSIYSDDTAIHIVYSIIYETQLTGILNFVQTIFVCICLTLAAVLFEADANTFVLEPLEVMIEIVQAVAKDPMGAKNVEDLQTGIKACVQKVSASDKHANNYEVLVIKGAIIKISALLAIGFGEAGGEIITKNLSSGTELNPRLKGKSKTAIFGFCDIRNFEQINLALEERTILFVNQIAEIVHSSVDRFKGATNKNIGEAFLNVWKFYNEVTVKDKISGNTFKTKDNLLEIDPTSPQVGIVADCSVLAFLRVILKINKDLGILLYRTNEAILKHIHNFNLTMGFGLHMGYGIEGAVGSSYKIDASYLSPNVNISARLESATRQFGVSLLLSGVLYNKLTKEMKNICRFVDCVMVKGSEQPLELYTIDINYNVTPQRESKILIVSNKEKRAIFSEKKLELQTLIEEYGTITPIILEKQSYRELIKVRDNNFTDNWQRGILAYKSGDWEDAIKCFKVCKSIDPNDGPAKTLINYIKNHHYVAPENWNGVRELTSK